jgi:hypothetical protein
MSLLDMARVPPSKRRKSKKSKSESISRAEAERRARQRTTAIPGIPRVIPWLQWCELRGISVSTGNRLERDGKVKVTHLSARRKGVREDHDQEYLDSCTRGA